MARLYSTTEVVDLLEEEMETKMDKPCFEGSGDDMDLHISDEEERLDNCYKNCSYIIIMDHLARTAP